MAQVFNSTPLILTFHRALVGDKLAKWNELVLGIAFVQLDDHQQSRFLSSIHLYLEPACCDASN